MQVYTPRMGHAFSFFADTYDTERIKILSVWSQFSDGDLGFRPAALSRTVLEQMVHQCASEDVWMRNMLQIDAEMPALPPVETRGEFLAHYAAASGRRLEQLRTRAPEWFTDEVAFFDVRRSRAWVLLRRIAHTAHHRGQLTVYLRLLGRKLYSTYGPTADTGGLFQNQAQVIYRYDSIEELLSAEQEGGRDRPLPGPGARPPTERP
jgi:uncharacterized damage-inducible protein DinB